jgi:hypothetical protein
VRDLQTRVGDVEGRSQRARLGREKVSLRVSRPTAFVCGAGAEAGGDGRLPAVPRRVVGLRFGIALISFDHLLKHFVCMVHN